MSTKTPNTDAKATAPDWERIELDYRAGIKSLREISDGSGVSHVAISKRAKKAGWTRDLSQKIQAKADELVNKAAVNTGVNTAGAVSERATIDGNAQAVADVKLAHRRDIHRARSITNRLLDELEAQVSPENQEAMRELGKLMFSPNQAGRDALNDIYMAVIGTPERAKTMKTLAESLRITVELERAAFNMDGKRPGGEGGADGAPTVRAMSDTERAVRLAHILNQIREGAAQEKQT